MSAELLTIEQYRHSAKDELVRSLLTRCKQAGLPEPVREFQFHVTRKWRYDCAWLGGYRLLVDIQGGTWNGGKHTRGAGYREDCIKAAEAVLLGYRVLWVTSDMIRSDEAVLLIERLLRQRWILHEVTH